MMKNLSPVARLHAHIYYDEYLGLAIWLDATFDRDENGHIVLHLGPPMKVEGPDSSLKLRGQYGYLAFVPKYLQ